MQIWTTWLHTLDSALALLASDAGLGAGLAIVVLTLLLRFALLPVSWSCAYRSCVHQKRVRALQPELERIRQRYRDNRQPLVEETLKVYRASGVTPFESRPLLGALVQMPVLLGMFQVLRDSARSARFLWIESLSRPDFWIALLAGATTAVMMLANPDLPEQMRILLIALPAVIAFVFALKFASGLALYWVVSNSFTAAQTYAIHRVVGRRIQSGALRIS